MARRKKGQRRIRSPHPGVVILKRTYASGETAYRARWFDPDANKVIHKTFKARSHGNHTLREEWAIGKSEEIADTVADMEKGSRQKYEETTIAGAAHDFIDAKEAECKPSTVTFYKIGIAYFLRGYEPRTGGRVGIE